VKFFRENILVALQAIKANRLRAIITMLIISIGITALVGILSAIDAIKNAINNNFTEMGANTFTIRNAHADVKVKAGKSRPPGVITFREAMMFRRLFSYPVVSSISTIANYTARIRYRDKKTNPNIQVLGADENYLTTAALDLSTGRNFTPNEILSGAHTVLISQAMEHSLFDKRSGLDKRIRIGPHVFQVIGILKQKGSSAQFGGDKMCIIPLTSARQYFGSNKMNFSIDVLCRQPGMMNMALDEAQGVFRRVRGLSPQAQDDFEIVRADSIANMLIDNLKKMTMGATIIGLITLLGAAIGLMNIMLVSVTERTREIGIRKAMGATPLIIQNQFLIESIVICILGGLFGILLGMTIGNLISLQLGSGFFVPWFWVFSGIFICVIVGLLSGYLPAKRAAALDPIESLRFE
jgi:putative ABC transport system permease protein